MNPHVGHDFCEYHFVGLSAFCLRSVAHLSNAMEYGRKTQPRFFAVTVAQDDFFVSGKSRHGFVRHDKNLTNRAGKNRKKMKKFQVEFQVKQTGCRLLVCRQFLSTAEIQELLEFLENSAEVKVGAEVIRGREARRKTCSFGEFEEAPGQPMFYQYSGKMQRV